MSARRSLNRSSQIHAENSARIQAEREQMAARWRNPVNYSSAGALAAEPPPITVERDPLLELLKKGKR